MKPYGINKTEAGELDATACADNGRATHLYSVTERSYRSLRRGKKGSARRIHKRRARSEGKRECSADE